MLPDGVIHSQFWDRGSPWLPFWASFLTGPPSLRLLPPALFITAVDGDCNAQPLFFLLFTIKHPRTVVALDGLNALSDAIALYHNNDRLSGTSPSTVRPTTRYANRSPACLSDNHYADRPPPTPGSRGNVSFQTNERGDRRQPLDDGQ